MTEIDERLRYRLLEAPGEEFHVIVRTDGDAAPIARQCERSGLTVHREFRLLPGLAVTATGEALLALAHHPHVTHIEADQDVQAL